jgi:hypothetical protein
MEPEGSLPHAQVSATCPCPESDQSVMPQSHFLKSHFNIILPFMPRFSNWALSLWFPQPCVHLSSSQDVPHASPRSTDDKLFMQSSPLPCYLVPLLPKYVLQHPIFRPSQPLFLPRRETPSFMSIQTRVSLYLQSIVHEVAVLFGRPCGGGDWREGRKLKTAGRAAGSPVISCQ